jgi:hypothetical protein
MVKVGVRVTRETERQKVLRAEGESSSYVRYRFSLIVDICLCLLLYFFLVIVNKGCI